MRQIIRPLEEFGPCLKRIVKSRRISASELARMMAYKSRNSIFRMLGETGGHGARQAFFERLTGEDPLSLEESERLALEQALEVSRVGRHAFLSNCALHEMLGSSAVDAPAHGIRIEGGGDDPRFHQALAALTRGRKAYIAIMGCCDRAIFEAIRKWICRADAACEVKVTHLIYTGAEEIVHNISAIQPLLYCDCYTAYCVEPGVFSREREALYRHNCIHIQAQSEQGQWHTQTLVLMEKGIFIPLERANCGEEDRFMRYFAADMEKMPLLKAQLPDGECVENYLSYTQSCRKLEMNRTVYMIKPDIPLTCVHPDILLPCVKAEFWQMAGERADTLKEGFYRIHLDRWENLFGTRRNHHVIFSQEEMERFARTGRQSDHMFAIRAYTPRERAAILTQLKKQAQENPCFCMRFFKAEFRPPMMEIGLYEGAGTLMTKPQTHYDLAGDHAEVVIEQAEFCERYREFYAKDLMERHVVSSEETMQIMDRLIEVAQSAT